MAPRVALAADAAQGAAGDAGQHGNKALAPGREGLDLVPAEACGAQDARRQQVGEPGTIENEGARLGNAATLEGVPEPCAAPYE
jgi:hypothetical protein